MERADNLSAQDCPGRRGQELWNPGGATCGLATGNSESGQKYSCPSGKAQRHRRNATADSSEGAPQIAKAGRPATNGTALTCIAGFSVCRGKHSNKLACRPILWHARGEIGRAH